MLRASKVEAIEIHLVRICCDFIVFYFFKQLINIDDFKSDQLRYRKQHDKLNDFFIYSYNV